MRKLKRIISATLASILALSTFTACKDVVNYIPNEKIEGSSLYVKKVEDLPDDFILGMDASSVIAEEQSGVKYYNFNGEEQDVFRTLAESGVTTYESGYGTIRMTRTATATAAAITTWKKPLRLANAPRSTE